MKNYQQAKSNNIDFISSPHGTTYDVNKRLEQVKDTEIQAREKLISYFAAEPFVFTTELEHSNTPDTSVEMLKSKNKIPMVCATFGKDFRSINVVQKLFYQRPLPDEALCAILWDDYSKLENVNPSKIMVLTLRMLNDRLTKEWLIS